MDETTNEFINSIRRIVESMPTDSRNVRGTVVAVDEAERTCEVAPLNGDASLLGARLVASIDAEIISGVVFVPQVGSSVIVSLLDYSESEAYVSKFGAVEKVIVRFSEESCIELSEAQLHYQNQECELRFNHERQSFKMGNINLEISPDQLTLNGDEGGGLIKIKALKNEWDKNKAILETLLQVLGGPPITEPGNGAPSALQMTLQSALAGKQAGKFEEGTLTNKQVVHGE